MADIDPSLWDQAINGYNRGPVPAPAIPPVVDTPITPSAEMYPSAGMLPPGVPGPGGVVPQPDPHAWAPTQLSPEEETQFQQDMVSKPGYKDWYEGAKKDWGEAPNFNDPQSDYDYRGAWKGGVVPSVYEHDGKYHWESSLPSGQMLKSPDHPTGWMEYFMRATGKDPNEVGVKNEKEALMYVSENGASAYKPGAAPSDTPEPAPADVPPGQYKAPKSFDEGVQQYGQAAETQAQAVQNQSHVEAQGQQDLAALQERHAQELAALGQQHEERQAARNQEKAQIAEEFKTLQRDHDDTKVEYQETTRSKIAGALALVGAGIADGFARMGGNNGTNYVAAAQQQIDQAVKLDLERQREAKADKKSKANAKMTEWQLADKMGASEEDREALAVALTRDRYGIELQKQASLIKSDQLRAVGEATAADIRAGAAKDILTLQERLTEQRYRSKAIGAGAGGGGGLGAGISVQDILDRGDKGTLKNQKELDYYLKLDAARGKDEERGDKKAALAAKTKDAEEAGDLEVIANYETIPGTKPLDKTSLNSARKVAAGVAGLRQAGGHLANLFEQIEAADKAGDSTRADQLRAEYGSAAGNWLIMKSLASGQGVVNEADARRDAAEGAAPPPPGAPKAWAAGFSQQFNGLSPSARTIREINAGLMKTGQAQMEGYNLRPKQPGSKPKPAQANPAPSGKVAVIRTSDGAKGYLSAADAADKIASGKYKAAQ